MPDFFSPALTAIYRTLGVDGSFDILTEPLRVIDKTGGFEVTMPGSDIPTVVAGVCVRVKDIEAAGLSAEDFIGAIVTVNGSSWKVIKHLPRPTPQGESKGEFLFTLREVA